MFSHVMFGSAVLILLSAKFSQSVYTIPKISVEPLEPRGLRMSIPDEEGISQVTYHILTKYKLSTGGFETRETSAEVSHTTNGRWVFNSLSIRLRKYDVFDYWINVIHNGVVYEVLNLKHSVTDFYDRSGNLSCPLSETKLYSAFGDPQLTCRNQLIFEENFVNLKEISKNWTIGEHFSNAPDREFAVYMNNPENIQINNGLKISPILLNYKHGNRFIQQGSLKLRKCTKNISPNDCYREAKNLDMLPSVSSGRLSTENSLNFEFARIEIRAKFPRGDWLYPLLMLEPVKAFENPSLAMGQIRIASTTGNADLKTQADKDISGHILWGGATGFNPDVYDDRTGSNRSIKYNEKLWADDFHTYELTWSPNKLALKVDGELYDDRQERNLPTNKPFYLTLGLAVGGLSEFPDGCISNGHVKPWINNEAKAEHQFFRSISTWEDTWKVDSTSLEVKYVKIWAL